MGGLELCGLLTSIGCLQIHSMPPARSFVTESQQLCAHILGLLQVIYADWQLLHQTASLGLPQRVVGLHTGMPVLSVG